MFIFLNVRNKKDSIDKKTTLVTTHNEHKVTNSFPKSKKEKFISGTFYYTQ